MRSSVVVDVHLEIVAEREAVAVVEDIGGIPAHVARDIGLGRPTVAAVRGAAYVHVPAVHATVRRPGVHPRNADDTWPGRRDGRKSMVSAGGGQRHILFGSPGRAAIGRPRE